AAEREFCDFFEACVKAQRIPNTKSVASWLTGELFAWLNLSGKNFVEIKVTPAELAELIDLVQEGLINQNTAKAVFVKMLESGASAGEIVKTEGLAQTSDGDAIAKMVSEVISAYPEELASYKSGKENLSNWFFGQVMKAASGKANPAVLKSELETQLQQHKLNS
ncbi:MAG: Asp-tRNA(Asn)/Glu-tRNA(Gln) amidotransferase GatCAB subunit B, partial [Anaerolineae bacterium]|nr:Asp-tRNA(Asn)/Glu-tRNA(Gln) amidotransferase GatCAB subunit B [Anaerolineae bacterium]